jgi:hypothetical protein
MRKVLRAFAGLIVVVLGALGAVLAFDVPVKPPPLWPRSANPSLASISARN